MLRLFLALPCPSGIAAQIDAWRQSQHFAGRPVPTANLHVTLAFLGQVPESRLQQLQRVPPRLALADLAFDLHLTLARDSRPAELRTPPSFAWHVDQLHLYQSAGGQYLSLQRWPLGQP